MVVEIKRKVCDGVLLKILVTSGLAWLQQHEAHVNQLNVFPVPDGDTGTNMRLTLKSASDALTGMEEPHAGIVAEVTARAALRGARGNSGVILSQLLAGFATGLRGQEVFDAKSFAHACQVAVEFAYRAVIEPVEGTILTVAREGMEAALSYVEQDDDLAETFEALVRAVRRSLAATPDLLPRLRQSGVVDSGGQGLLYILEGMSRVLRGEPVIDGQAASRHHDVQSAGLEGWQAALEPDDAEGYGYDVQFLMHGDNLDVAMIRAAIDSLGWSTLVVGDSTLVKVHVHVHDPGQPLSYAISTGASIDDVVVENMQAQYQRYVQQHKTAVQQHPPAGVDDWPAAVDRPVAVVAVASGEGFRQLLTDMGAARIVIGGQTMNPSAEEFLDAIHALPGRDVVILPNNPNIILAARQAADLATGYRVRVVPTASQPAGISALLAYGDQPAEAGIDPITGAMEAAARHVISAEITHAVRDFDFNGVAVRQGQVIGIVGSELAAAGDTPETVIREVVTKAGGDECELVTLYYGDEVTRTETELLAARLAADFPHLEFATVYGGQPLYPFLLSIE
jgi:hypothetical protein